MLLNNTGLTNVYNQIPNNKKIFITGGTGTLGRALLSQFPHATVYSRDPWKQQQTKRLYPDARFVLGDVRDYDSLFKAMTGHDIVIHAAAMKHIPQAEDNVQNCVEINVIGSSNVAYAAVNAGIERCVGISTDKVCYPINVYGHSKALMERLFLEYNKIGATIFTLCRYGNVIGSTGSVVDLWRKQIAAGQKPTVTSYNMTRFWLSEEDALYIVGKAVLAESGTITIPLAPGLSMGAFVEYVLGDMPINEIGPRAGEKMHECLVTNEEVSSCVFAGDDLVTMHPGKEVAYNHITSEVYPHGYNSNFPTRQVTKDELLSLVGEL